MPNRKPRFDWGLREEVLIRAGFFPELCVKTNSVPEALQSAASVLTPKVLGK